MSSAVLIVEDRPEDRYLLRRAIRKSRFNELPVHEFESAEACLDFVSAGGAPDADLLILLLDINLPGMSGLELLDVLRARALDRNGVVAVCSSSENPRDHQRARRCEAVQAFLVKPVTRDDWESFAVEHLPASTG